MERRYFLFGALGAAVVGPARAAAQPEPVRVGVIGVRGRGAGLAAEFAALPDCEVAYLCDVDSRVFEPALKAVAAAKRPRPKVESDLRKLLDDPALQAVIIATPDHWHAAAAILACQAGKDVYVEKPASHNFREGEWMIDAARSHKRVMQVGTQSRSHPAVRDAIAELRAGRIGKVLQAKAWNVQRRADIGRRKDSPPPSEVDFDAWTGPAPMLPFNENRFHYNWHWHWNYGTGDAGNDGVHQLDVARWALDAGLPDEVHGTAGKLFFEDDQQTPDTMNMTFQYPGKSLIWEMRIWAPYGMEGTTNTVAVYGSEGMMQIGTSWFRVYDRTGKLAQLRDNRGEGFGHARNFIDCVRSRARPNADIEIGHISAGLAHLANIVARTGRPIRWDAERRRARDDRQASELLGREYRDHWSKPKAPRR